MRYSLVKIHVRTIYWVILFFYVVVRFAQLLFGQNWSGYDLLIVLALTAMNLPACYKIAAGREEIIPMVLLSVDGSNRESLRILWVHLTLMVIYAVMAVAIFRGFMG
jgi:hypothetical protein